MNPLWGPAALAAEIAGQVVDADGGGVDAALVVAYDLRLLPSVTETDMDGRFVLSQLRDQPHRLRVIPADTDNLVEQFLEAGGDFCASPLVGESFEDEQQQVQVELQTGAVLTGRLVDQEGQPLIGAKLTAKPLLSSNRQVRWALSNWDGVYRVQGLPDAALAGDVTLRVEINDWPRQYVPGVYEEAQADVFSPTVGEETVLPTTPLLAGISVSGAVVGPDGAAQSGEVHVFSSGQVVSETLVDGSFEVQGLPPGEVLVWGSAADLAHTYYPDQDRPSERLPVLEEGQQQANADLFPPYGSHLRGRLLGSGDLSTLWVLAINDDSTVALGAEVAADGSFEVEHLHAGSYSLMIYASGTNFLSGLARAQEDVRVFEVPFQGASELFEIALQAGVSLQGVVLEEQTGQGLAGMDVVVEHAHEGVFSAVTEEDGSFVLAGIPAGDFSATVNGEAFCPGDPYWTMTGEALQVQGQADELFEWQPVMRRVLQEAPSGDTGNQPQGCACSSRAPGLMTPWMGLALMALVGFRRAGRGRTRG